MIVCWRRLCGGDFSPDSVATLSALSVSSTSSGSRWVLVLVVLKVVVVVRAVVAVKAVLMVRAGVVVRVVRVPRPGFESGLLICNQSC